MIAISKPEKNLIKNRYGGKKGYFSERLHLIHAKIQVEKKFWVKNATFAGITGLLSLGKFRS